MSHYLGEGSEPREPDYRRAYMWLRLFEQSGGTDVGDIARRYEQRIADHLTPETVHALDGLVRDGPPDPEECAAYAAGRAAADRRTS